MNHDAAVGQHLALIAGDEQQRGHARRHSQADGTDGAAHGLHGVIEGKAALDLTARAVDVERDERLGVLSLQVDEAANDGGAGLGVDGTGELELAGGEHLVADVEAGDALGGLAQDLRDVGDGVAHGGSFRNWHAWVCGRGQRHRHGRLAAQRYASSALAIYAVGFP